MASWLARSQCPNLRARSPVIQRLWPVWVAMRPSRLVAVFSVNSGRPRPMRRKKPRLSRSASASATPVVTSTPWPRSRSIPFPAVRGSGSAVAITARATPAASNASQQGGVCPWWAQGSSET